MNDTRVLWRILVLPLFLISLLGPWMFDVVFVPAQFTCEAPFIRLNSDFCGIPLSGFETILWFVGGVSYTFGELLKGNFASQVPELLMLMGISIIVLPSFSSFLLVWKQHSRPLQTIDRLGWGLAGLLALTMFRLQLERGHFVQLSYWLWGLGLYILLAISVIGMEILTWRWDTKPGTGI